MEAVEKLRNELTGFKDKGLPRFAGAIAKEVERMLEMFCAQDARFAETILAEKRTLTDCVKEVLSGVQYVLSDVEAYRRAVAFYFPGADIDVRCLIVLPAEKDKPGVVLPPLKTAEEPKDEPKKEKEETKDGREMITVSLLDLL